MPLAAALLCTGLALVVQSVAVVLLPGERIVDAIPSAEVSSFSEAAGEYRHFCYQCANKFSNTMCNSEAQLSSCDLTFDTCQTIIHFSEISQKMTITKRCATNESCANQVASAAASYPCDRSAASWICVDCCYEDKCNRDSAALLPNPFSVSTVAAGLAAHFATKC